METSVTSNRFRVNENEPAVDGKSNLVKPSVRTEATTTVSCTRKTPVVPNNSAVEKIIYVCEHNK